jgi:hypothetical protein
MAARRLWKARTRARRRQLFVVGAHSRPSPVQLAASIWPLIRHESSAVVHGRVIGAGTISGGLEQAASGSPGCLGACLVSLLIG